MTTHLRVVRAQFGIIKNIKNHVSIAFFFHSLLDRPEIAKFSTSLSFCSTLLKLSFGISNFDASSANVKFEKIEIDIQKIIKFELKIKKSLKINFKHKFILKEF